MNTLLQDIEASIKNSGGPYNLAHLIMKENRYSFTVSDRREMSRKARKERVDNYQPYNGYFWNPKDEKYLKENWGKRSPEKIAYKLRRTVQACRDKMYRAKNNNIHNFRWKQSA